MEDLSLKRRILVASDFNAKDRAHFALSYEFCRIVRVSVPATRGPPLLETIGPVRPRVSASQRKRSAPFPIHVRSLFLSGDGRRLPDCHTVSVAARAGRRCIFDGQSRDGTTSAIGGAG